MEWSVMLLTDARQVGVSVKREPAKGTDRQFHVAQKAASAECCWYHGPDPLSDDPEPRRNGTGRAADLHVGWAQRTERARRRVRHPVVAERSPSQAART